MIGCIHSAEGAVPALALGQATDRQPPLVRTGCPFCRSASTGRYQRATHRFICVGAGCSRFAERVDYSTVVAEIDRLDEEFFDRLPGLLPGHPSGVLRKIAREQLSPNPVQAYLALRVVVAWNELYLRPPLPHQTVLAIVDDVAGELRRRRSR